MPERRDRLDVDHGPRARIDRHTEAVDGNPVPTPGPAARVPAGTDPDSIPRSDRRVRARKSRRIAGLRRAGYCGRMRHRPRTARIGGASRGRRTPVRSLHRAPQLTRPPAAGNRPGSATNCSVCDRSDGTKSQRLTRSTDDRRPPRRPTRSVASHQKVVSAREPGTWDPRAHDRLRCRRSSGSLHSEVPRRVLPVRRKDMDTDHDRPGPRCDHRRW